MLIGYAVPGFVQCRRDQFSRGKRQCRIHEERPMRRSGPRIIGFARHAKSGAIRRRDRERLRVAILVLSGPVGAGKTTVARELIWPFPVEPRKGQSRQASFLMTLRAMFAAASRAEGKIANYTSYRDFDVDEPFVIRDELSAEDMADRIRADLGGERFRV